MVRPLLPLTAYVGALSGLDVMVHLASPATRMRTVLLSLAVAM